MDNQNKMTNQNVEKKVGQELAQSIQNENPQRISNNTSARFETSEQTFQEELSLKNITQILIQNWALFLVLFILMFAASLVIYKFKIPYQSVGSIIINDAKNSSLQSFTGQFSGQNLNSSKTANETKKTNSAVLKNIEYLGTEQFLTQLLTHLSDKNHISEMNMNEKKGYDLFLNVVLENKEIKTMNFDENIHAVQKLDNLMKINLKSDYEAEVTVQSLDKNLSYFVSKNSIDFISNHLRIREKQELDKIKKFLTDQKSLLDVSIRDLNKKLSDFQSKPENLISLSANKVGDYLSELMVRKNEVKMKISENNKLIEALTLASNGRRDSALYGNSGKINSLKIENELLQSKMSELQKTLDKVMSQAKSIPTVNLTYDELKKKVDLEFENYKTVSQDLSKIEASELSLDNKFEVLEKPRFDKVRPLVSVIVLLLLSILFSQVIGSIIIYVRSIWDTKYVTAEKTRNIVIIDGHSLDPRVIIENSKIKFSLQNSSFQDEELKNSGPKKIGFSISRKKAANDDRGSSTDESQS